MPVLVLEMNLASAKLPKAACENYSTADKLSFFPG